MAKQKAPTLGYYRQLAPPKNMKDGLCNFVQMIINTAEAGNASEAMYLAVDLLDDLRNGTYDGAMGISAASAKSNLERQMEKDRAEAAETARQEYIKGVQHGMESKRREILLALGLEA